MYYGFCMATITLKDVSASVHKALKQRALQSGRSLNREIIAILASAVKPQRISADELIAELKEHRSLLPGKLDDRLLDEARRIGRP